MTKIPRLTRRRFLRAAGLAAGSAWLAGCAPTGGPAPPSKPSASQPTAAPTTSAGPRAAGGERPLKIGVVLPYSGVYALLGESITNAMELYFASVGNTAGGRPIVLLKEDEGTPDDALRKTRKLVEQDQVDILTGMVSTASAYAVRDYVHENKVLFICSNAGGNDLTRGRKSPYIYRTSFANAQLNAPMGEFVYKNIARRVFISGADYAAGREQVGAFRETFAAAGGEIVGEAWPPFPNNDYAPYLTQIAQARPEASYSFYAGSDAVNFVKQFAEFGLKSTIRLCGGGAMIDEDTLPAQGQAALGGITGMHYTPTLDTPENRAYVDAYRAKYNREPDSYSVQGYDTARWIVEAVNQLQGDTSDKLKLGEALLGIKFVSPRGPVELDPETHNIVMNIYAREVREVNGRLTNVVIATFPLVRDRG
ncbi:MAG TPA: ABC transporter substrate-binding protein [Chloroflexota bacterium]|jgi:branched-chain amino acid transport system substrate-binding protein|nr:ABC transporter substrate-binding protein [Chloroflexota bacterium]